MRVNLVGPFIVNAPFGTEIAFSKGLKRIGVETTEVDPNVDRGLEDLDPDADATIVFKTCCGSEEHLDRVGGLKIVYQPDDARFSHVRQMMLNMRAYCDHFLSFDSYGTEVARHMRYETAEVLLLTADDELYCPSPQTAERDIDVSFIGSLGDPVAHASRRKMLEIASELASKRGWKTSFGSTQDIPKIVDTYRRSKVVLNHATDVGQQFGMGFGFQCRHFEVGMTKTCLLTNEMVGGQPWPLTMASFDSEESLAGSLDTLIGSSEMRELMAGELYDDIRAEHLPQHRAKQLVDYIERIRCV